MAAVDPAIKADVGFLNSSLKGQWAVQSQTRANDVWLIGNDPITAPPRVMVYDRARKSLTELYVGRPALSGITLPAVCPVEITARDGLTLVSYLTLPAGSDPTATAGPTSRCRWCSTCTAARGHATPRASTPRTQWLANRGYAVLAVNFRGSTGFGKDFVNAANKEWAARCTTTCSTRIDWAVKERHRQRDKSRSTAAPTAATPRSSA